MKETLVKQLIEASTVVERSHGAFGEPERFYRVNSEKLIENSLEAFCQVLTDKGFDHAREQVENHFGVKK